MASPGRLLPPCPPLSPQREVSHFFGYVYFRQVKDVSVKRGYFQKVGPSCPQLCLPVLTCLSVSLSQSLVLVSRLPYVHLFHSLLQIMAPEFFQKLEPCLEAGDDL